MLLSDSFICPYILLPFWHICLFIVLAYFIVYLADAHLCLLLPFLCCYI